MDHISIVTRRVTQSRILARRDVVLDEKRPQLAENNNSQVISLGEQVFHVGDKAVNAEDQRTFCYD